MQKSYVLPRVPRGVWCSQYWLAGMLLTLTVMGGVARAEPMVGDVVLEVAGNDHVTLVRVTFSFTHPDNTPCHIALIGHDAATRRQYTMVTFAEGDIYSEPFTPGPHTVTWIASADTTDGFTALDFKVYVQASDTGRIAPGQYLVIDVSGGPSAFSYPVDYKPWIDVTQDVYKTDRIVLRQLPDGSYAGVYEVTQKQYEHVTGLTPSYFGDNPMRPVEEVSWNDITGDGNYDTGFIHLLRSKTGLNTLDLPHEDAWEYACRAGTTEGFNDYTTNRGRGVTDIVGPVYSDNTSFSLARLG